MQSDPRGSECPPLSQTNRFLLLARAPLYSLSARGTVSTRRRHRNASAARRSSSVCTVERDKRKRPIIGRSFLGARLGGGADRRQPQSDLPLDRLAVFIDAGSLSTDRSDRGGSGHVVHLCGAPVRYPTARPAVSLLLSYTPHVAAILVKHQVGDLLIDLPEELYLSVYNF
jgi:hypothetical protein